MSWYEKGRGAYSHPAPTPEAQFTARPPYCMPVPQYIDVVSVRVTPWVYSYAPPATSCTTAPAWKSSSAPTR